MLRGVGGAACEGRPYPDGTRNLQQADIFVCLDFQIEA
jgi:hypothetical protein